MADSRHFIVSFENVTATVGGADVSSIVEIQVQASANDIPSVTLLVDAGHPGKADGSSVAAAMDLEAAKKLYSFFIGKVRTATLDLSVTARSVGAGGGDTQTLEIKGWTLTDVMLSPIQESGAATVALTCCHPVCKAHFGGAVPGLLSRDPDLTTLAGDNPLAVFTSALGLYASAARIEDVRPTTVNGAADPVTVREKLIGHLTKATAALSSAVTWAGNGLPVPSSGIPYELIRYGLSVYAMPSGGTSVFQRLVGALVPECSLALGGDYTKPALELRPFTPWEDATLTVKDSDIVSLQFPQSDPSPLSGVRIVSVDTADTLPASYHVDTVQTNTRASEIFYVPDAELNADLLYGPVQQVQEPGWLAQVKYMSRNASDGGQTDERAAESDNLQTPTNTDPDNPTMTFTPVVADLPAVNYGEALLACAKAYYETALMKDWGFTVTCRFLLAGGGTLCPGRVIAVTSPSGKALEGYVTAVTHTISVTGKTARTTVACTHPRIGGALPRGMSAADTKHNALYE